MVKEVKREFANHRPGDNDLDTSACDFLENLRICIVGTDKGRVTAALTLFMCFSSPDVKLSISALRNSTVPFVSV